MTTKQSITGAIEQVNGLTLVTKNLGKRFGNEWIFRNLSYEFSPGNLYAITGPNGSGKSTLLHVLWGQVPPTAGELLYRTNTSTIPVEDIYTRISIAAPYMDLIDEFTFQEQINFHFKLKKIRNGFSVDTLGEVFGIRAPADKFIGNFSSGMKQRLKLALAFYTSADIIFLDEPGTNLDSLAFEWYKQQVSQVPSATTIIIASNNPKEYPADAKVINLLDFKP